MTPWKPHTETPFPARGSATLSLIRNPFEFWLDSKIPETILVIPVYQIKVCISRDSQYVTGFWKTVPNHTTTEIHSIA